MKFKNYLSLFRRIDWQLFVVTMLLVAVGLIIQYSLGLNSEASNFSYFRKQLVAFGIGLVMFFGISFFDFRALKNYSYFLYGLGVLLAVAVLFFGKTLRGTRGWFMFGSFGFQAVEFVKVVLIIVLAKYWSRVSGQGRATIKRVAISGILTLVPLILIILQPDLGSALILFVLWFGFFLLTSRNPIHIIGVLLSLAIVGIFAWFFLLAPYQKDRLLTFLMPGRDPLGVGYQVTQSIIAVGSGKFFGRGLGLGPQSQLRFLPDSNTDFVFSVIAEEFGFLGAAVLLGLYIFLLIRFIKVLKIVYDDFSLLLVFGVLILIYSQVFINIGMNIGLVPVTGIPLPLVSYGGSFLVITLASLGLLESIMVHRPQP